MPSSLDECVGEMSSSYFPKFQKVKTPKYADFTIELELPGYMGDYEGLRGILRGLGLESPNSEPILNESRTEAIGMKFSAGRIQSSTGWYKFESRKVRHTTRKNLVFRSVSESEGLKVEFQQRGIKREKGNNPRPGPNYDPRVAYALLAYIRLYENRAKEA